MMSLLLQWESWKEDTYSNLVLAQFRCHATKNYNAYKTSPLLLLLGLLVSDALSGLGPAADALPVSFVLCVL